VTFGKEELEKEGTEKEELRNRRMGMPVFANWVKWRTQTSKGRFLERSSRKSRNALTKRVLEFIKRDWRAIFKLPQPKNHVLSSANEDCRLYSDLEGPSAALEALPGFHSSPDAPP